MKTMLADMDAEIEANPTIFDVQPTAFEGVSFDIDNGRAKMELTADQAEAFGIALILSAHNSRNWDRRPFR